jgi:hypothetical protein
MPSPSPQAIDRSIDLSLQKQTPAAARWNSNRVHQQRSSGSDSVAAVVVAAALTATFGSYGDCASFLHPMVQISASTAIQRLRFEHVCK